MLSDADMARVWATAHNGGLSVLSGIPVNGSIALDLQSIATHGLTPINGASLLTNVQLAIDLGTLVVKDISTRPATSSKTSNLNASNRSTIVNAIPNRIWSVQVDLNTKVCRRQGVGSPVVSQCFAGAYGALCYPKCNEGYKRAGAQPPRCVSRLNHLEKTGLFCYPPCATNQVGPFCWPDCVVACVSTTVDILGSSATITLTLVSLDDIGLIIHFGVCPK
ncbi:hypothetical protein SPRG_17975 [Saprolegnia parasitica CBS 223.65]|uniref:Uncharacterized protein n=1 Tax=Saprolegnia parasitica (strain CBS 223.65) TaxID=695850 RepID=A0A067BDR5_SAPPC|nr:hypothetical protein SPRG_17975 [Saprolegnia parasitica CBS 223.65]KDO16509.1 hypothetical protein SPRG_17975 [Saprolegnia parasitica CBS 223.65]|eukprot:XP_012212784.1 hypothetical protein SPRG_17975 [Saprolegnia parasitica CBS 223.65]